MIPSICQKMQALIDAGITEENHVVYLFTCIRKILEQEEDTEQWDTLKFYCDWVLHAKLSGRSAQNVLAFFDEANTILAEGEETLPFEIQNISKFSKLTSEVERFLSDHQVILPEYSSSDWSKFIFFYTSIIEDCPLVINPHITEETKVSQVTARMELAEKIEKGQQYYKISWLITDNDGNIGELFVINSFDS